MKIRIKENSVRFRLTKSEVSHLATQGSFAQQTEFDGKIFKYKVEGKEGLENLDATFEQDEITMFLPFGECKTWYESENVGYRHAKQLSSGNSLTLVLEKDFVCLDETEEDQSDNFPNPNKGLLI